MPTVIQREAARRDLVEHFVHLAEAAGLDVAERFLTQAEASFLDLACQPNVVQLLEFNSAHRPIAPAQGTIPIGIHRAGEVLSGAGSRIQELRLQRIESGRLLCHQSGSGAHSSYPAS